MKYPEYENTDLHKDMVHAEKAKRETRENLKFMKENRNRMTKVNLKSIKDFVQIEDQQPEFLLDSADKLELVEDWNRQN